MGLTDWEREPGNGAELRKLESVFFCVWPITSGSSLWHVRQTREGNDYLEWIEIMLGELDTAKDPFSFLKNVSKLVDLDLNCQPITFKVNFKIEYCCSKYYDLFRMTSHIEKQWSKKLWSPKKTTGNNHHPSIENDHKVKRKSQIAL